MKTFCLENGMTNVLLLMHRKLTVLSHLKFYAKKRFDIAFMFATSLSILGFGPFHHPSMHVNEGNLPELTV